MILKNTYMKGALCQAFIGLVRGYKLLISPLLSPRCRYLPTCSAYAIEAFQQYGVVKGGQLTLKRLCRCHPWGGHGIDPVPLPYIRSITKYNE